MQSLLEAGTIVVDGRAVSKSRKLATPASRRRARRADARRAARNPKRTSTSRCGTKTTTSSSSSSRPVSSCTPARVIRRARSSRSARAIPEIAASAIRSGPASCTDSTATRAALMVVALERPRTTRSCRNCPTRRRTPVPGAGVGQLASPRGMIDAPIGRSEARRTRMAVRDEGRPAAHRLRGAHRIRGAACSLLVCRLETGRTHQIRVHLAAIGHPIVGDGDLRRATRLDPLSRPFLHAARLASSIPPTGDLDAVRGAAARRARGGARRAAGARPRFVSWSDLPLSGAACGRWGSPQLLISGRESGSDGAGVADHRALDELGERHPFEHLRVSSSTPTHTSCRMQWPSQWSG